MRKIEIPDTELEFSYARSSGAGGQNVNKVNSKVILQWNVNITSCLNEEQRRRFVELFRTKVQADGFITITSQEFRDQPRNAARCIEKLKEMIAAAHVIPKKRKKTKPTRSSQRKRMDTKKLHGAKKQMRREQF